MPETISQPNYGSFRTSVSVTTFRNIVLCSGLALPLLFLTSAARAELPTQLNVEGVIVFDGMVGDETVTIGIGLFPEPTGGIAQYTESFPGVQLVDGRYQLLVGGPGSALAPADFDGLLYLETTVTLAGGAPITLSPRSAMQPVPAAITAKRLDVDPHERPGANNTALGVIALRDNTTGASNTANGVAALLLNQTGSDNTANGVSALRDNNGSFNTASGRSALQNNATGSFNTANGRAALLSNTGGSLNTASGHQALTNNVAGSDNTANGAAALRNTTGSRNIALGKDAGINLTTGSDNIAIGSPGVAGESATIRIGTAGTHTTTHLTGAVQINDLAGSGTRGVVVDASGTLRSDNAVDGNIFTYTAISNFGSVSPPSQVTSAAHRFCALTEVTAAPSGANHLCRIATPPSTPGQFTLLAFGQATAFIQCRMSCFN